MAIFNAYAITQIEQHKENIPNTAMISHRFFIIMMYVFYCKELFSIFWLIQ